MKIEAQLVWLDMLFEIKLFLKIGYSLKVWKNKVYVPAKAVSSIPACRNIVLDWEWQRALQLELDEPFQAHICLGGEQTPPPDLFVWHHCRDHTAVQMMHTVIRMNWDVHYWYSVKALIIHFFTYWSCPVLGNACSCTFNLISLLDMAWKVCKELPKHSYLFKFEVSCTQARCENSP